MKKRLLVGLSVAMGFASVAQNSVVAPKLRASMMNLKLVQEISGDEDFVMQAPYAYNFNPTVNAKTIALTANEQEIGFTYYGQQTNFSIVNRTQLGNDGSIAGVWTMSHIDPTAVAGFSDRGMGYQYSAQGGSFTSSIPAGPSTRVEDKRTGFGSYAASESGTRPEVIVAHQGTKIHVATRSNDGTGSWTQDSLPYQYLWPQVAYGGANNSTIHFLARTKNPPTGVVKTPKVHGQLGAITYFRSQNNGATWDKKDVVIPDLDSSHFIGFGAENYTIDARGDVVAIVAGFRDKDCILLKSTDNGDTWTKTVILSFPIDMYNDTSFNTDLNNDGSVDTIVSTGGSYSVVIDHNNNVHIAFDLAEVVCDTSYADGGTRGLRQLFTFRGIGYWNEVLGGTPTIAANIPDLNNDGNINLPDFTPSTQLPFGLYGRSLASQPSLGLDVNDNVYLSYSAITEGTFRRSSTWDGVTDTTGQLFRHIFIVKSLDGGVNWSSPFDILTGQADQNMEAVYGSMAKNVDGFCHIIYQKDTVPGTTVTAPTATSLDNDNYGEVNHIIYSKIPVTDITTGIKNAPKAKDTGKVSVYPNPATSAAQVIITLTKSSNVAVSVFNSMGAEVAKFDNTSKSAGVSKLNIDVSHLTSGIYFIKTQIDNEISTTKLVVR